MDKLAEKLNPQKLGFSPMMTAIVGALIGHDYGVRDRKGGKLGHISITSDGFVQAESTAHESGAFIGDARDLENNVKLLLADAKLTDEEKAEWYRRVAANVTDWRNGTSRPFSIRPALG